MFKRLYNVPGVELVVGIVLAVVLMFTAFNIARAVVGIQETQGYYVLNTVIDATTTSATSNAIPVPGAKSVVWEFSMDGPYGSGVGTTTYSIEVSVDGSTYHTYNKLITNDTSLTRAASADLTATTSAIYTMDLQGESFYRARCVTVEAGTTTATCKAFVQY